MEDTTIANVLKTFEDFYAKKDYKSALQTLEAHPESMSIETWHYNLGLVYARLENWPESRFHFLAAEKNGLNHPELVKNSLLVTQKLDISKAEKPTATSDYLLMTGKFLSSGELTTISLVILVVGLLSLKKKMTAKKITLISVMVLTPVSLGWVMNSLPEALVMKETKVQEGPSGIFGSVAEIPAGVRVITESEGDWRKILYPARYRGWIQKSALKELE